MWRFLFEISEISENFENRKNGFLTKWKNSRGFSPGFWGKNSRFFSNFTAVIVYTRVKNWRFSGGKFRGSPEIPGGKFREFPGISGISGISTPKKSPFLQIARCKRAYPPGNSGDFWGFFGHFFSQNVTNLSKKCQKSVKKHQKNTPKNTPKFSGVFCKITAVINCWKVEKWSKKPPGFPALHNFAQICKNLCTFFSRRVFGHF